MCSHKTEVLDNDHLIAHFDIPGNIPSNRLNLVLNSAYGGVMASPQRLWVEDAKVDAAVINAPCYQPLQMQDVAPAFSFPNKNILNETIRNLNFHVPMWFSMIFLMLISFISSILFLRSNDSRYDDAATASVHVGLLFAFCGLATGATWARFTWGDWWTSDPQLNGAAISTLIYLAYFLLRRGIDDQDKRARIAAVYAIFSFVMFYVFVKVIPGMADFSLHPDTTDNPSFKDYDVEDQLKVVFRLAASAWIALGFWIFTIKYRLQRISQKRLDA